jgi:hypothetical protein
VAGSRLELTREQILAFRRKVGALDERLPPGARSLRIAAWAGLQDSMPRAALLSIHARAQGATPSSWEDPSLVQVWGLRYCTYVVPAADHALFTLARLPEDGSKRHGAEDLAARLEAALGGARMTDRAAGLALGLHSNRLRYASLTGTVLIRWEGARAPVIWTVPPPEITPLEARLELARRYLHVFGPATPASFAEWAGILAKDGLAAFDALRDSLIPVGTPIGDAWLLGSDEEVVRAEPAPAAPARLLPSGDAYYLLQGADRELLVQDAARRALLWTSRVWPGAIVVEGEVVGTWRRAQAKLTLQPWQRLSRAARAAVEAEADALPLPGVQGEIVARWDDGA